MNQLRVGVFDLWCRGRRLLGGSMKESDRPDGWRSAFEVVVSDSAALGGLRLSGGAS
ncbi:hypothetical protein FH972_017045 [Carpinus fangiana]|uniref:Uncharacterized protein n=1 Tax=Carpinus fangiana TaxID=176857 RepID=A0A5N6RI12_9ROSI|nr:hypothetical protein FH972_017045 [Carpinus fangiana]